MKEKHMKRLLLLLLLLITLPEGRSHAQPVTEQRSGFTRVYEISFTLAADDTGWVYFSCPNAQGSAFTFSAFDTSSFYVDYIIVPPKYVLNTGAASLEIEASTEADTTSYIVYGLTYLGRVITDVSTTAGADDDDSVYGDGAPHRITLTGIFDNVHGYAVRIINHDLANGFVGFIRFIPTL